MLRLILTSTPCPIRGFLKGETIYFARGDEKYFLSSDIDSHCVGDVGPNARTECNNASLRKHGVLYYMVDRCGLLAAWTIMSAKA